MTARTLLTGGARRYDGSKSNLRVPIMRVASSQGEGTKDQRPVA